MLYCCLQVRYFGQLGVMQQQELLHLVVVVALFIRVYKFRLIIYLCCMIIGYQSILEIL